MSVVEKLVDIQITLNELNEFQEIKYDIYNRIWDQVEEAIKEAENESQS